MKAVIYARYSSDKQSCKSIDDQERLCKQRAESEGILDLNTISDSEVRGYVPVDKRPGGASLLKVIQQNTTDMILIESLDRLSRDPVEQEKIIRLIEFQEIRLIGVSDGYDSMSDSKIILRGMRGIMSAVYLDDLGDKTHRGLSGQVERGHFAGGLPFGYRSVEVDGGYDLKIVPDQAEIIERAFELYASGKSPKAIAHLFNKEGILSPRGKSWAHGALYGHPKKKTGILRNPIYRGKYIWNRSEWLRDPVSGKRKRRERPESDWIEDDRPELRIISEELWNQVQKRLQTSRQNGGNSGPGRRARTLLGGLISCGNCGGAVTAVNSKNYGCSHHKDRGPAICDNSMLIHRDKLESAILSLLQEELLTPESISNYIDEVEKALNEGNKKKHTEIEQLKNKEFSLTKEIENLLDAVAAGSFKLVENRLSQTEKELHDIKEKISLLDTENEPDLTSIPNAAKAYREAVADLRSTLSDHIPETRNIIQELVDEITITNDNNESIRVEIKSNFLNLLRKTKHDSGSGAVEPEVFLNVVAGAGFEPTTFRL